MIRHSGEGGPTAPFTPGGSGGPAGLGSPGGGPGYATPASGYGAHAPQQPPYPGYGAPQQPQGYPGYGQHRGDTYTGGASPSLSPSPSPSPSAAWPVTTADAKPHSGDTLGLLTTAVLAIAGLLGLGYAAWAFTARRGVFAEFADGGSVSSDDAKSSDQIDTIFLIVAGALALLALTLWVVRKVGGRTKGGGLDIGGLAAAGLGAVVVLVGLFLAGGVSDGGSSAEQGDKGVTAALVLGAGFTLLAIGLLIGLMTARGPSSKAVQAARGW